VFTHPHEKILVKDLAKFPDLILLVVKELKINLLCEFIYNLCVKFNEGYNKFKIVGTPEMKTRCLLLLAIRNLLDLAFHLVGIVPLQRL